MASAQPSSVETSPVPRPAASSSARAAPLVDAPTAGVVRWRVWPLMDEMPRSLGPLLAITGAGAMVGIAMESLVWAILAALLLALAWWRHFVPVRYEVTATGLRQEALGRAWHWDWADIRCVEVRPAGLLLSDQPIDVPIAALRSFYLPCREHRDDVLAVIASLQRRQNGSNNK